MGSPEFNAVKDKVTERLNETLQRLAEQGFTLNPSTPREFYDYLTGETFSGDKTTLDDILNNDFLMIHEAVEISELKRLEATINTVTLMETPKRYVYEAHLNAIEFELMYALIYEDYHWIKHRLGHHGKVLEDDPWMPDELRPKAEEIYSWFKKLAV